MQEEQKKERSESFQAKRSRILYEITALVVIVLVASGLATFFLVRASQSRLIEKSIDKVIETQSEDFSDTIAYMIDTMVVSQAEQLNIKDEAALFGDILNERMTDL